MQQFRELYGGRDLIYYPDLLSTDFLFVDQDGNLDDHAAEVAIANRLFAEIEGENQIVISEITISQLAPQGTWLPTPANDQTFGQFEDSLYRQFMLDLRFHVSGQNLILRVQGPAIFYVLDEGDADAPDFRLLGIIDATYGDKAVESTTWSDVRRLFD